jgi:hypothetical protein
LACLSRAINISTVGAAATGLVVFVFALFAPVLTGGAPHAAKNVADAANKINQSVFFIRILPGHYSISKKARGVLNKNLPSVRKSSGLVHGLNTTTRYRQANV